MRAERHQPPAVLWDVGRPVRSGAWGWLVGCWVLACMALTAWGLDFPIATTLWFSLLGVAGAAGYAELRSQGGEVLQWNRQTWTLTLADRSADIECAVRVVMDLQSMLLLKVHNEAGDTRLLWLDKRTNPERWHRLRCALYGSRQP